MSHSDNNLDRQKRRHKGPLIGFVAAALFAIAAIAWWASEDLDDTVGPQDTQAGTATE